MKESWEFKLFPFFFGFAFLMIISCWVFLGVVAYRGLSEVEQHGLKQTLETIWNGKDSVRP